MLGKIIMAVFILLVLSGALLIATNKYDMSSGSGRVEFAKTYFGWIGQIGKNAYSVTAYAVKMDWLPKN